MPNLNFRQILLIFMFIFLEHSVFANQTSHPLNHFYQKYFGGIYEFSLTTEKNKFRVIEDMDLTKKLFLHQKHLHFPKLEEAYRNL